MSATAPLPSQTAESATAERPATERRNPFPGPRPYERGDAPDFLGRAREIRELRALIGGRGVVVVVGPSGCGKSSLLRAGVRPALEAAEYEVLPIARAGEAARGRDALAGRGSVFERNVASYLTTERDDEPGERDTPVDSPRASKESQLLLRLLASRRRRRAEDGTPMPRVLIIDQFEELFTTHLDAWRDRVDVLRTILAANDGAIETRMVLVLRAEYLSAFAALLARLGEATSAQPRSVAYFHVERLTQDAARQVMTTLFTRDFPRFPVTGADALARQMSREFVRLPDGSRTEAEGEFVEPLYLQIVCRSLWDKLASGTLSADDPSIAVNADLDGELRGFVRQQILGVSAETGVKFARILSWLSEVLITPAGTRGSVIREAQASGGMPNAVVEALERRHLLRGEERAAGQWYELAHDQLVAGVRALSVEAREQRDRRAQRIARSVGLATVVLVLGMVTWNVRLGQSDNPDLGRQTARRAAELVDSQPDLATAVIQEALAMGGDAETDSIARWIASRTLASRVIHTLSRRPLVASAASPESLVAVGMEDGRVMVLNVLHMNSTRPTGDSTTASSGPRPEAAGSLRGLGADVRGVVPGWKGGAVGLAFAREGRRLAVASMAGRVALIAGPEWRPDGEITVPDEVSAVGASASGNEVAIGTPGGSLRRLPKRAARTDVRGASSRAPVNLASQADDEAFGYREPQERVDRRLTAVLEGVDPRSRPRRIADVAYTPTGDVLAVEANGAVRRWTAGASAVEVLWLPGAVRGRDLTRYPSRMALKPDGRILVVTAGDSVHQLRIAEAGAEALGTLRCVAPVGQRATALAFTPDGETLLVASDSGAVTAWEMNGGYCSWTTSTVRSRIVAIVPLPTGGRFVTIAENQEVRLWLPPPSPARVNAEVTTWLTQAIRRGR